MIGPAIEKMMTENREDFLIPADIVATVQEDNHLDHAFLVLTKIRYSKIPVLDTQSNFKGLLSMPMITDTMLELNQFSTEALSHRNVKEVMETQVATVENPYDVEMMLHLLVDNAFVPVVDRSGSFTGIVTRREYLKVMNHIAHDFEMLYDVMEKEMKVNK